MHVAGIGLFMVKATHGGVFLGAVALAFSLSKIAGLALAIGRSPALPPRLRLRVLKSGRWITRSAASLLALGRGGV
jgi:hypothetical protein